MGPINTSTSITWDTRRLYTRFSLNSYKPSSRLMLFFCISFEMDLRYSAFLMCIEVEQCFVRSVLWARMLFWQNKHEARFSFGPFVSHPANRRDSYLLQK